MAKNDKKLTAQPAAPSNGAAAQAGEAGDWGDNAGVPVKVDPALVEDAKALLEATAPVTPKTAEVVQGQINAKTAEVVQDQINAKTDEDVQRQERPEIDALGATLKEVEAKIAEATDVGLAFALLKELEAIPATTTFEKNIKRVCVDRVKRHCYDIQQGLPLVNMGANELAKEPGLNSASIRGQRLELESRTNPDIKDLLNQIAALNKQAAEQKKD